MIPILYDDGEQQFLTNGIGRLSDCLSCLVTEERNGIYECEFTYPITGERYADIEEGQFLYCIHDDTKRPQAFVIYGRSAPINGIVTFYAHHISYKLRTTVVTPFEATSITDAFNKLPFNLIPQSDFYFWTDKSVVGDFAITEPRAVRGVLGGEQGSILDVYGKGDYEWDMFTVKLHQSRGTDSGLEIRYGKNLVNIDNQIDGSDSYNAIVPFWKGQSADGSEVVVTLSEKIIVYSGGTKKRAYLTDENLVIIREENNQPLEVLYQDINAIAYDMSEMFEEMPTEEELRQAAISYLESSDGWLKKQNITVDFVQMWQTEEYKEYAPLQRVSLCDTVSVYYPELGVEAEKKKVIRTTYNVLTERYDEIELGDVQYSFAEIVTQQMLEDVPTKGMMDEAIQHATEMISGGLGGYVVLKPNANGQPEEILIMDTPDIDSAVNVIRMNKNGIGFSNNGYSGTFTTAWTIDGGFVADFITTGTLNANLIKAGVLSDVNGNTTFNLQTGLLNISKGSINLGDGNFTVSDAGIISAKTGNIGNLIVLDSGGVQFAPNSTVEFTIAPYSDLSIEKDVLSLRKYSGSLWYDGFTLNKNGGIYSEPLFNQTFFSVADRAMFFQYLYSSGRFGAEFSVGDVTSSGTAKIQMECDYIYVLGLPTSTTRSGNLYIDGNGRVWSAKEGSSSRKIKHDIKPVENDELNPERLYQAEVVQFKYNDDFLDESDTNRGKDLIGFIVEDLHDVYPVAVCDDEEDSKNWEWSTIRLVPAMLKLIQDQKKEIDSLSDELKALRSEVEKIKEAINAN